jgi:hypothetical protein
VPIARKRSINRRIKKINDSSGVLVKTRFSAGPWVERFLTFAVLEESWASVAG